MLALVKAFHIRPFSLVGPCSQLGTPMATPKQEQAILTTGLLVQQVGGLVAPQLAPRPPRQVARR